MCAVFFLRKTFPIYTWDWQSSQNLSLAGHFSECPRFLFSVTRHADILSKKSFWMWKNLRNFEMQSLSGPSHTEIGLHLQVFVTLKEGFECFCWTFHISTVHHQLYFSQNWIFIAKIFSLNYEDNDFVCLCACKFVFVCVIVWYAYCTLLYISNNTCDITFIHYVQATYLCECCE